jgi:hypothetical protein
VTIFHEKPRSRKQRVEYAGRDLVRNWFCMGTSDADEVYELALANNPQVYRGLLRKSIELTPLHTDIWDVDVPYGIGVPTGLSPDVYAFKIGTESVHITQGRETLLRRTAADNGNPEPTRPDPNDYLPDGEDDPDYIAALASYELQLTAYVGSALDHNGAIGVTEDSVAGCDILTPKMEWSKSVQRPAIDLPYLITLFNLVGKTNDAEFYGFPVGTLLYLGAEPTSAKGALADGVEFGLWGLTHQFAYSRTRLNLDIGGITIPRKRGWEYVWTHFGYVPATKGMKRPPDGVYVERVYEAGNYELLEIGTEA